MGDIWRGDHQSIIYRRSINITIKLGSTAQSEASPALSVCLVLEYLLISIIIYHKHIFAFICKLDIEANRFLTPIQNS